MQFHAMNISYKKIKSFVNKKEITVIESSIMSYDKLVCFKFKIGYSV